MSYLWLTYGIFVILYLFISIQIYFETRNKNARYWIILILILIFLSSSLFFFYFTNPKYSLIKFSKNEIGILFISCENDTKYVHGSKNLNYLGETIENYTQEVKTLEDNKALSFQTESVDCEPQDSIELSLLFNKFRSSIIIRAKWETRILNNESDTIGSYYLFYDLKSLLDKSINKEIKTYKLKYPIIEFYFDTSWSSHNSKKFIINVVKALYCAENKRFKKSNDILEVINKHVSDSVKKDKLLYINRVIEFIYLSNKLSNHYIDKITQEDLERKKALFNSIYVETKRFDYE